MPYRLKAVAFDLDEASLMCLGEALPEWEIEVVKGAKAASLTHSWNPGAADLLIVKARAEAAETLGLCRFLVRCGVFSTDSQKELAERLPRHRGQQNQALRVDAPLLVLVPSEQEPVVRAALEAGAAGCLVLPIHAKQVVSMLARVRQGNRPGRHTLNLDIPQREDRWRDDGGQG